MMEILSRSDSLRAEVFTYALVHLNHCIVLPFWIYSVTVTVTNILLVWMLI